MNFNIALLQIAPHGNDQMKNLEKGLDYCRRAERLGADLALFPELWNIGFTGCPFDEEGRQTWETSAIDRTSTFFRRFVALARELEINIALTYLEKHHPKPRNTVSIVDRKGKVVLNYSKVFICNFGKDEIETQNPGRDDIGCDFNCTPGNAFDVCTLTGKEGEVQIGAMICADREFPEAAGELMLMRKGAELVVVPNACNWDEIRTTLLEARAFENLVGIAVANYPAPKFNGQSQAYTCVAWDNGVAKDTVVAGAGDQEEIVVASFDVGGIRSFRKAESWRLEHRRHWRS